MFRIRTDRDIVKGQPFPSLLDVTIEELGAGLESGLFTSVDLVNVCCSPEVVRCRVLNNCRHTLPESWRSTQRFMS